MREEGKGEVNARYNVVNFEGGKKKWHLAKRKSCAMPILPEPVAKVLPVTAPI